jgi:hypothetical protein
MLTWAIAFRYGSLVAGWQQEELAALTPIRSSQADVTKEPEGYFVILKLYGPTKASFDKSWKSGDIEEVK